MTAARASRKRREGVVDRAARDAVADTICEFLAGRIRSNEVLRRLDAQRTRDRVARDAAVILWSFYDDLVDHPFAESDAAWEYLRRLAAALRSGLDMGTATTSEERSRAGAAEPFLSEEQWRQYEWLLDGYQMPPYDPAVTETRHRTPFEQALLRVWGWPANLLMRPILAVWPLVDGPLVVRDSPPIGEPHPAPAVPAPSLPGSAPAEWAPDGWGDGQVPGWIMWPLITVALAGCMVLIAGLVAVVFYRP